VNDPSLARVREVVTWAVELGDVDMRRRHNHEECIMNARHLECGDHFAAGIRAHLMTGVAILLPLAAGTLNAMAADDPSTPRDRWRHLQAGDPPRGPTRPAPVPPRSFRSYDGTGNNLANASWGAAGTQYLREASGAHYADGRSAPAGSDRPGARELSNALASQGDLVTADERGLSTAIYEFGQFLDHDLGLALGGSTERFDIPVPRGDAWFDPASTGTALIYMDRSGFDPSTGVASARQQINRVTSFIDASHVYGSDATRAAWLRAFVGGRLRTRATDAGELLPLNDGTQANDNPLGLAATSLSVAGDVRANEQPGLTSLHVVFVREHNFQAARLATLHRDWNDERLYQEARRIVGAEMQAITCNEFLPALLGHRLPPYRGYNARVNPGISNVFATAGYRFGHSQVGPDIGIVDDRFVEIGSIGLASAFFNPGVIASVGGVNPFIRYMAIDAAQAVDVKIVDPLRNFLFGPPGAGGLDLASLNIQRGRDHGLGSYNQVRGDFGLPPVASFSRITSDAALASRLQSLYGSVDRVDAWVGLLAEDHRPGASVGPTADAVITDQFRRLRDGDRLWYQNAGFDRRELELIDRTTLADIIARNTGVVGLQRSIFFAADLACRADFDRSGSVDQHDLRDYLAAWNARDPRADFNGDGRVDSNDSNAFVAAWNAGC